MMKKLLTVMALFTTISLGSVSGALAGNTTFLTAQDPGDWASHRLVGTKVFDGTGAKLGDINDVILDVNGQAAAVVIGVGGYLGFNEKSVAVPFYQIQIGDVVGGSRVIVLNATKAELKAAPPYTITDPSKTDRLKKLAKNWGSKVKDYTMELSKKATDKAKEMKDKATDAMKKQAQ